MNEPLKDLKQSLDDWAAINKNNTEIGFVEALFTGSLVGSPIIDKFSTWLLAGSGATAALMIAYIDKILPILGGVSFKNSIYILLVSALFGFLAKYKAIYCQTMFSTVSELKKLINPVLEKHGVDKGKINNMANENNLTVDTDIDMTFIHKEYCKAFPKIMHPWLRNQFQLGITDRLTPSRKAINGLFWQGNYTVLQFLSFLIFVYVAINNIQGI